MKEQFLRTQMMFGEDGVNRLASSKVAVFGIGGVGGYVVEALARAGIGTIGIIDDDKVSESNINRQIFAVHSTVGRFKVDVAEERIKDINPDCKVNKYRMFYLPEKQNEFRFTDYDYIVDAIDTVSGKISIIKNSKKSGVPVISAMGAGNKFDPTKFEVADISETSVCPLARVMRKELHKRGIDTLKVVYSKEKAIKPAFDAAAEEDAEPLSTRGAPSRKDVPGSNSFVPSVMGLIIAGEVIKDISGFNTH